MRVESVLQDPRGELRYLERYVNDGSNSGFTERFTTSVETRPFGRTPDFPLLTYEPFAGNVVEFGNPSALPPDVRRVLKGQRIFVHPDMKSDPALRDGVIESTAFSVTPTSSARTVQLRESPGYIKLNYSALIGRASRELTTAHARASVSLNEILCELITNDGRLRGLSLFPEPYAACVVGEGAEIGYVYRGETPFGSSLGTTAALLPFFSLFAKDRNRPDDLPLLIQLVSSSGRAPFEFLFDQIIEPLIRCYFTLVKTSGLQPEWHAQNLLLGVSDDSSVTTIVLRDLESTDVDLTIRRSLALNELDFMPYKHIHAAQYNYQVKHSFMYDFKLGEYVLEPLIDTVSRHFGLDKSAFYAAARSTASHHSAPLGKDYFPTDVVGVRKTLFDRTNPRRPYISLGAPKFR